jgi:hypothetical protein
MYGLLLNLYPQEYLRRHRAEMLQNLEDFECTSSSKAELWLFLGKDLAVSLRSQFARALWGQTAIVVIVLAILLVYTERHAVARQHPVEGFCCGYILGWFAGWFGELCQASSGSRVHNGISSLPSQATIVVSVLVLVIAISRVASGAQNHVIWALCYGFLLAWIAGWIGNRWRLRP